MMQEQTPRSLWTELKGLRATLEDRWESYSAVTLPTIFVQTGSTQYDEEYRYDYQSVGAQAVNYLANKLMLTLFRPSAPFVRLDPTPELLAKLAAINITEAQVTERLALTEKDAVKELDARSCRPKLFESIKHLIVTGNALLDLTGDSMRALGLKNYVVRRMYDGRVCDIVIKQDMRFDQLAEDVQAVVDARTPSTGVCLYRWITYEQGKYHSSEWVDDQRIDLPKYKGAWDEDKLPYCALTWTLRDGDDYGVGLVENYHGDFRALSEMSEGIVRGALLSCEYRWLVNPGGQMRPSDLTDTPNGAAVPGLPSDVSLLKHDVGSNLSIVQAVAQSYIQRIGRGFLLSSAVTRDAERVTAEEIRMQANELESTLGGVYSRLAQDMQRPIADWLLGKKGVQAKLGTGIKPTIVTGLDALSRTSDLENLKACLADLIQLGSVSEQVSARLNLDAITQLVVAGYGLSTSQLLLPPQQVQQNLQMLQAQQQAAEGGQPTQPQPGAVNG